MPAKNRSGTKSVGAATSSRYAKSGPKAGEKRKPDAPSTSAPSTSASSKDSKKFRAANVPKPDKSSLEVTISQLDKASRVRLFKLIKDVNRLERDKRRPPALREKKDELREEMEKLGLGILRTSCRN